MTQVHKTEISQETLHKHHECGRRFQTWSEIPYHWDPEAISLNPPWREEEPPLPETKTLEDIPF